MRKDYVGFITDRFAGKTVHIVASGPSLADFDYKKLRNKTVIAVNHAYKKVPWFDCKVATDANFFQREDRDAMNHGPTLCPAHACDDARLIHFRMSGMVLTEPGPVYAYGGGGIAALSIALQGKAENIILWGYDYSYIGNAHHATQGEFKHSMGPGKEHIFRNHASKFSIFPRERIFNASLNSAVECFKKISHSEALNY